MACRRFADAELLWHGDRDLDGVDAVVVPGGFSYGDYLRVGAIARFSPVMEAVTEFAREGGPVLGICNGFQVLCEAGLLPGALLPNDGAALRLPPGGRGGGERRHALHARVRRGRAALDPGQAHDRAATTRRKRRSTSWTHTARSSSATPRATTPTARSRDIAGVCNRRRQRDGPDAAPRARGRPAHRLRRRRRAVRVARGARRRAGRRAREHGAPPPAPRARAHRRRVRPDRREAGPRAQRRSSWPCSR